MNKNVSFEDEIQPQSDDTPSNTSPDLGSTNKSQKQNYRKDKPWDDGIIDRWKTEGFKDEDGSGAFLEESSFATLFPQYREKYLREVWKAVTAALDKRGIACELNLVEGSMTVRTTRRTRDPFIILKSRDFIKLLARSVPLAQAVKILDDEMQCDIVKIGNFVDSKERFVKRRERLIGPKGSTLKALELLTECYMLVQGNTVACMGGHKGLRIARRIVEDCMKNVHPVYNIKALMIKRELQKDPELKHESWDRFLPKFKRKNVKKKSSKKKDESKKTKDKKEYSAFPPLPQPSKIDLQLESGEYFLSEQAKRKSKVDKQKAEREQTAKRRQEDKEKAYIAPVEEEREGEAKKRKGRKREREGDGVEQEDLQELAARIKKRSKKKKTT